MIIVLAGVNGAGKSSIGGSGLTAAGVPWYNPDAVARDLLDQGIPGVDPQLVAGMVWQQGLEGLKRAAAGEGDFNIETTLGGQNITNVLLDAIANKVPVHIWFCGLNSVELHLERVAERVKNGGHDIPERKIRERFRNSVANLCRLTPGLTELQVFDNSQPLDANNKAQLRSLLHVINRRILHLDPAMPEWAKPIATIAIKHFTK